MQIINRQRARRVDGGSLVRFVEELSGLEPPAAGDSLALCLVSDRRMREMNRTFRGRDATTDVLSFPAGRVPGPERGPLGDIVISVPTAARQAGSAGRPLMLELKLLALHGYLHLLGHDHETDDGQMRRVERRLARRLLHGHGTRRS